MAGDTISDEPTLDLVRAKAQRFGIEVAPEREESILIGARFLHDAVKQLNRFVAEHKPSTEPLR